MLAWLTAREAAASALLLPASLCPRAAFLAASQALLTIRRLRVHQDDRHLNPNVAGRKRTSLNKPAQHHTVPSPAGSSPLPGSEIPQDAAAVREKEQKSAEAEERRC